MTKTDWQKAVERARRRREQQQRDEALRARFASESFVRRFRSAGKSLASLIDLVDEWTTNSAHLELVQEGPLHAAYVTADREIPEESDEHFTHCIESLRASLDQLAFTLSESNTGRLTEQQERSSSFPIHRTLVHANDQRAWKGISLMSARAADAIRALQPASAFPEDPQTSPLFLLADLAERSKHRTGLVAATAVAPSFTAGNGTLDYLEFNSPSIVPGERNMIFRIGGRVPERTVMSIDIVTRISVPGSVADGMHLTSTLTGIADYIDRVVFPKLMRTV